MYKIQKEYNESNFIQSVSKISTWKKKCRYEFRAYDSISTVCKKMTLLAWFTYMTPHAFSSTFFIVRITLNPIDTHMWKNPEKRVKIQNLRQ